MPTSAEALEKWGEKEFATRHYSNALSFFQQSLKVKDSPSVRRNIALILADSSVIDLFDSESALKHAERAFKLAPHDYTGLLELFKIYMELEVIFLHNEQMLMQDQN